MEGIGNPDGSHFPLAVPEQLYFPHADGPGKKDEGLLRAPVKGCHEHEFLRGGAGAEEVLGYPGGGDPSGDVYHAVDERPQPLLQVLEKSVVEAGFIDAEVGIAARLVDDTAVFPPVGLRDYGGNATESTIG